MEKLKTKILLEVIDDIIIEYPDTNDLIQQKLNEKCDREGISIDKVICFFNKSRSKKFSQTKHVIYQSQHVLLPGLKVPFVHLKY